MIHLKKFVFIGLLCLTVITTTHNSTRAAEKKPWSDAAELSYVQAGGNSDVTTFAAKNTLKYSFWERWTGTWRAGVLYGQTDGIKSAERYETDLRMDYSASERFYYYGLAGWLQDKFAGFDSRYYAGPGAGYRFVDGPRHFLSSELGANYAKEEYTDETESDFLEGRAFGKYEYVFNDNVKFSQQVEYLHNFQDSDKYKINATTELTTKLTDQFSVKVSYEVRYDNRPTPDTLKNTDTLLSVALVVNL